MMAKISISTTCTIALATALGNVAPVEARTMKEANFTANQEQLHQETPAPFSGEINKGCVWVPGIGWVCTE